MDGPLLGAWHTGCANLWQGQALPLLATAGLLYLLLQNSFYYNSPFSVAQFSESLDFGVYISHALFLPQSQIKVLTQPLTT